MGGAEVNLAVLAATLVDVVDFFPVTLLFGVSKFLFSALALSFVLAMLASYVVAMTVIPLFCAALSEGRTRNMSTPPRRAAIRSWGAPLQPRFQPRLHPHPGCI